MKTRSALALASLVVLALLPLVAQTVSSSLPGIPAAVREALLRSDTQAALDAIDKAAQETPALADTLLYLRAVALSQGERRKEALEALDRLDRTAPKSSWSTKASFLRADLLRL